MERLTGCAVLLLLAAWQLLFINRGIDLSDSSYYLANYKLCFLSPGARGAGTILTNVVGAWLYAMPGGGQLIVFRGLEILAQCVICLLIWRMLPERGNALVALALLCGSLFLKYFPMVLSYNTFSMLFFALSAAAMLAGLRRGSRLWLLLSGALAGINVLFRLPNLLQCCLAGGILLYGWRNGWEGKRIWALLAAFCGGYFLALCLGFGAVAAGFGLQFLLGSYGGVAQMGKSASSAHGILNMVRSMLSQLASGGKPVGAFAIIALPLTALCAPALKGLLPAGLRSGRGGLRACMPLALSVLLGAALSVALWGLYSGDYRPFFMAFACAVALCALALYRRMDGEHLFVAWLLLASAVCVSAGTSNGLGQFVIFGGPILAMTLCLLIKMGSSGTLRGIELRLVCAAAAAFVLAAGLQCVFRTGLLFGYTYRDAPYSQLSAQVKAPELAGMRTTPQRAALLDAFYEDMQDPALSGYPLAIAGRFPAGYVICDNLPFFDKTWSDLASYPLDAYKACISQREAEGVYPVIAVVDGGGGVSSSTGSGEKYQALMGLVSRHDYILLRDDADYRLYVPAESMKEGR